MPTNSRPAMFNLCVLLFGALPVAIAVGWLTARISPPEWAQTASRGIGRDMLAGFTFWYLSLFVPVVAGGLLHQLVLKLLRGRTRGLVQRLVLVATAPIILLGFIPFRGAWGPKVAVPALVALALYGLIAKPWPEKPRE